MSTDALKPFVILNVREQRELAQFHSRDEAIEMARRIAHERGIEVVVYDRTGRVDFRIRVGNAQITEDYYLSDRIVFSNNVCHGKPRIAGTRIMVHLVLDLLAAGKTVEEITSSDYYPDLTAGDVYACIAYASRVVQNDEFVATE